jgi:hypothetical protein
VKINGKHLKKRTNEGYLKIFLSKPAKYWDVNPDHVQNQMRQKNSVFKGSLWWEVKFGSRAESNATPPIRKNFTNF